MYSSKHLMCLLAVTLLGFSASLAAADMTAYSHVTQQRLENPEPHNWLMYRGNYQGWGYSPPDQISTDNVGKLQPVWTISTSVIEGHQAPSIVNDGVMFLATPMN